MKKVIIYASDSCGYCHQAKKFLMDHHISFQEKKVDFDKQAQMEMMQMGAKGVPVIKVNDEIIFGFDLQRLEQLFGKQVISCPHCGNKMNIPKNRGTLKITCPHCSQMFQINSNT